MAALVPCLAALLASVGFGGRPAPFEGSAARAATAFAGEDRDVEREWRVRAWALGLGADPGAARERASVEVDPTRGGEATTGAALLDALAAEDWELRFDALDALGRSASGAHWCRAHLERVLPRLVDEHPNVRVRAVELCARAGLGARILQEHGDALQAETFPAARRALAEAWLLDREEIEALAPERIRGVWDTLRAWAGDSDPQVARAARLAMVGGAWADPSEVLAALSGEARRAPSADGYPEPRSAGPGTAALPARSIPRADWMEAMGDLERSLPGLERLERWRIALAQDSDARDGASESSNGDADFRRAAFELVALRRGDSRGLAGLDAGLTTLIEGERGREALLETARARPHGLAPLLWAALDGTYPPRPTEATRRPFLLECAAEASDPWRALERAQGLDASEAEILWETVGPGLSTWDPERGAHWIEPDRPSGFRMLATRTLARLVTSTASRDPNRAAALETLLNLATDTDEGVRHAAFRALCDVPGLAATDPRLRQAWSGYPPDVRLESLRSLPRGPALRPFRRDLLELGAHPATRSTSVVELLAPLVTGPDGARDGEVVGALEHWLGEVLEELGATPPDSRDLRVRERMARSLLQALDAGMSGERALRVQVRVLDRALAWGAAHGERELELAAVAAGRLGRTALGRQRAAAYLETATPRVRLELALALVRAGTAGTPAEDLERAEGILDDAWGSATGEERERIVAACARGLGPGARALLERVAEAGSETAGDWGPRFAAFDGLARAGDRARLASLFQRARAVEVRAACLSALASIPGEATHAFLAERVREYAPRGIDPRPRDLASEESALLLDEALMLLAARGELGASERGLWLARARASAAEDLRARFAGRPLPRADFRMRTDLRIAESLIADGQLAEALAGLRAWERLDGEVWMALARLVRDAGEARDASADGRGRATRVELAARLFEAALVATLGEAQDSRSRSRRVEARFELLALWEAGGRFGEMAHCAGRLSDEDRAGGLAGEPVLPHLEGAWGALDFAAGRDPRARLRSTEYQARSLAAHREGRGAEAARWARRARRSVGASRAAQAAQVRLEAVLSGPVGR